MGFIIQHQAIYNSTNCKASTLLKPKDSGLWHQTNSSWEGWIWAPDYCTVTVFLAHHMCTDYLTLLTLVLWPAGKTGYIRLVMRLCCCWLSPTTLAVTDYCYCCWLPFLSQTTVTVADYPCCHRLPLPSPTTVAVADYPCYRRLPLLVPCRIFNSRAESQGSRFTVTCATPT